MAYHNILQADYIVYLPGSAPWHKTECNDTSYESRLIVLDEFDHKNLFIPPGGGLNKPWYNVYFKRSFVTRQDGLFLNFPHMDRYEVYPITYSLAEAYISPEFQFKRGIDILCTLR